MIIVAGTKRSGTSVWMHLLATAGVPVIGERFPLDWAETLAEANPLGFYESQLIHGVYFRTNPHPESGAYLRPEQVHRHAVKIFTPGLIRTDLAFIDHVLATVREWRGYCRSLATLRAMAAPQSAFDPDALESVQLPPALEWWSSNFALIRDAATRGYPIHATTLQRLLESPHQSIADALHWLGVEAGERVETLAEAIEAGRGSAPTDDEEDHATDIATVSPRHMQTFDDLYATIHEARPLTPSFTKMLNQTDLELRPMILETVGRARVEAARQLLRTDPKHGSKD